MRLEEDFEVVKKYLAENAGASARKVSVDTGVSIEVVTDFVRQGRIMGIQQDNGQDITCAICKRPIASGKLCIECQKALSGSGVFQRGEEDDRIHSEGPKISLQKEAPRTREQMYTIDLIRRRRK